MQMSLSHLAARIALASFTSIVLAGCDSRSSDINTAPPSVPDGSPAVVTPSGDLAGATTLGGPLADLGGGDLARFTDGQTAFQEVEEVDDGLGPVFNEASCGTCHNAPLGGTTGRLETRFGRSVRGVFDPLTNLGGSLIQDHAIGRVTTDTSNVVFFPEHVPRRANVRAGRLTTPLFGLGLVDAVPDATLLDLAAREARNSPATAGTPSMTTEIATGATRVGRFGWKSQNPTLHQFAGDAYLNEMGITNPEFPTENCPQGNCAALAHNPVPTLNDDGEDVTKFADFMSLLGPPPRGPRSSVTELGGRVFGTIGCADCHTPSLSTGDSPVPALSHKTFQPFSDFLLHDMGSLGDGIVQGTATARQMRTAPLWGLSARPAFLHDGRARTPQAAILFHDGQGAQARRRYLGLRDSERRALLSFLASL